MSVRNLPFEVAFEYPGSEITGEVLEFVRAMAAYQKKYRRRYPTWSEALYVLRTLGYAKRVPGADWGEAEAVPAENADPTADEVKIDSESDPC